MRRVTTGNPPGFTIFEVVIVISLMSLALTTLSGLLVSNDSMAQDSRAYQRAEAEHRRNLVALSNIFRTVDIQTLGGFGESGVSTNPVFNRVTGADLDDRTYTADEQLLWIASPRPVSGVSNPGAVYLVKAGVRHLIADRIPSGGFYVRQQGRNMLIHLTTYYTTNTRHTVRTTSDAVVSLRN